MDKKILKKLIRVLVLICLPGMILMDFTFFILCSLLKELDRMHKDIDESFEWIKKYL